MGDELAWFSMCWRMGSVMIRREVFQRLQTWGRCSAKNWWDKYQYGSVKASATLISWGLVKPCNQKNQILVWSFQASWWEAVGHFRGPSWPTSTREVSNLCNHRRPLGFRTRPFPEIVMTLASVWCQPDSIVANRMSRPKGVSSLAPLLQQLRSCYEVRELETERQNIPILPLRLSPFRPASPRNWHPQEPSRSQMSLFGSLIMLWSQSHPFEWVEVRKICEVYPDVWVKLWLERLWTIKPIHWTSYVYWLNMIKQHFFVVKSLPKDWLIPTIDPIPIVHRRAVTETLAFLAVRKARSEGCEVWRPAGWRANFWWENGDFTNILGKL